MKSLSKESVKYFFLHLFNRYEELKIYDFGYMLCFYIRCIPTEEHRNGEDKKSLPRPPVLTNPGPKTRSYRNIPLLLYWTLSKNCWNPLSLWEATFCHIQQIYNKKPKIENI